MARTRTNCSRHSSSDGPSSSRRLPERSRRTGFIPPPIAADRTAAIAILPIRGFFLRIAVEGRETNQTEEGGDGTGDDRVQGGHVDAEEDREAQAEGERRADSQAPVRAALVEPGLLGRGSRWAAGCLRPNGEELGHPL